MPEISFQLVTFLQFTHVGCNIFKFEVATAVLMFSKWNARDSCMDGVCHLLQPARDVPIAIYVLDITSH